MDHCGLLMMKSIRDILDEMQIDPNDVNLKMEIISIDSLPEQVNILSELSPEFDKNSNEMEETIWPVVGAVVDSVDVKSNGFNIQVSADQIEEGYYVHLKLKPDVHIESNSTAITTDTDASVTETDSIAPPIMPISDDEKPLGFFKINRLATGDKTPTSQSRMSSNRNSFYANEDSGSESEYTDTGSYTSGSYTDGTYSDTGTGTYTDTDGTYTDTDGTYTDTDGSSLVSGVVIGTPTNQKPKNQPQRAPRPKTRTIEDDMMELEALAKAGLDEASLQSQMEAMLAQMSPEELRKLAQG